MSSTVSWELHDWRAVKYSGYFLSNVLVECGVYLCVCVCVMSLKLSTFLSGSVEGEEEEGEGGS